MIGAQLTIPQLKRHMATTRHAVGYAGEVLVARAFEASGYHVSIAHEKGDLNVITGDGQIIRVEVKTARSGTDKRWHFTLWKHWQGRQCADHCQADVIVLLCLYKTGDVQPFVMPVSAVATRHHLAISSDPQTYAGRLAQYRQPIHKLRLPQEVTND